MRSVLWAWVLCLMPMVAFAEGEAAAVADPPIADSPELRAAAAARYMKASDIGGSLKAMADAMSRNIPEASRPLFLSAMKEHVRIDMIEAAMQVAIQKRFTTEELNTLADFYGSPAGKSAMAKMPDYMAEMMPLMQAEVVRAVEAARREQAEAAKAKPAGT